MNKAILALIKAVFSIASRIAPTLAGRAAFRLFCTTFAPAKKSAQHKAILASAQQQFDKATRHNIAYPGGSVAAFEFQPSTDSSHSEQPKTVWLVHGWQSHSVFMRHFVEPLLERGFRVICVDLPGHGRSSGRTFHLPLAVQAMHAVRTELGEFDMLLTHSLGGAVAAATLAGTLPDYPALPVEKLVLISSPDSMRKIFDDFSQMVGLNHKANAALHAMVTQLSGKNTDDFATGVQLRTVSTKLLLIHAPDDKEVPFSEAESIANSNPTAVLSPVPGLGHRRIIASPDVVRLAVDFIALD